MSTHTPEPWAVVQDRDCTREGCGHGDPMQEIHAAGTPIARFTIYSQLTDAERAVECVNACAGMAAPAAQLARLREALESAVDTMEHAVHRMGPLGMAHENLDGEIARARAILAGAEGR